MNVPRERPSKDTSPEPLRILLVDDIPIQRKVLGRLLTKAGHRVETAGNGEEALARLLAQPFDVLLTDWEMPGMDGQELCRRVREKHQQNYLYILMLTMRGSVADFVSGMQCGADAYVRKTADDQELLAHLYTAQRIIQLERDLSAARVTDSLLGIYRREYLTEQLPREVDRAWRHHYPLTIAMADLDHFKQFNDRYSHSVGDQILKGFCARVQTSIRQAGDWIARYGGEEFVIVFPHADLAQTAAVAEKLRQLVASTAFETSAGALTATVSMGVAELAGTGDPGRAAEEMLSRADIALYRSKNYGRNTVTLASGG
jgi:two-component system cell cycle response regulator